jgi:TPR repeat protein
LKLELVLPEWTTTPLEVSVDLRRIDGGVVARTLAWIVVPPPEAAKAVQLDPAALKDMLQRGEQLLGRGDVVGARAVYERAAEMGSGPAALAMGSTYDPNRLWSLGVFGMVGNKERARHWYARADQLGHPSAKDRLRSLGE